MELLIGIGNGLAVVTVSIFAMLFLADFLFKFCVPLLWDMSARNGSFLELELRSRQGGKWNKVKATLCCTEYFCNFTASLAFYNNFHILITSLVACLLNMPRTQTQALKRINYENTWKCFGGVVT
jgi:hypothetical protein